MRRKERIEKAKKIIDSLEEIYNAYSHMDNPDIKNRDEFINTINNKLKTISLELSTLRFIQSEKRLLQQVVIGVLSFFSGSAFVLLLKNFFEIKP